MIAFVFTICNQEGWGGKASSPSKICPHTFNFETTLLCVGDFSPENNFTPMGKKVFLLGEKDKIMYSVIYITIWKHYVKSGGDVWG